MRERWWKLKSQRSSGSHLTIRGPRSHHGRSAVRRISIELSESVWAQLKMKALELQEPISRLLEQSAAIVYGVASETDILALYQAMESGFEFQPESPPVAGWTFEVDTSANAPAITAIPFQPTCVPRPPKTNKKKGFGSEKSYRNPETIALATRIFRSYQTVN